MTTRREAPVKCQGKRGVTWKARYTNAEGKRVSAGTFKLKRDAQDAIDAAYNKPSADPDPETVGEFAATWTQRHPRASTTNKTANSRLRAVLDVKVKGRALRDWPYAELRRKHATDLVAHLLIEQGRAAEGARGIVRVLSAMTEDAINEGLTEVNPFSGVKIRDDDERVSKAAREPIVYTMEQMHAFAAASPKHEGGLRLLSDCGLRLGEMLGAERADYDGTTLALRGTALPDGSFRAGDTSTKKHVRKVPVAPSTDACVTPRIDSLILFPTPTGKRWHETNFYARVWNPARAACPEMADARPHDFRHSWVTHMCAQGIDVADVAAIAGDSIETINAIYRHALNRSDDAIRAAVG